MATSKKITETGPVGLRGIRNTDLYGHLSSLASSGDTDAIGLLNALSSRKSRPFGPTDDVRGYFEPQAMPQGTPYASLGSSKYDEPYIIGSDPEQVNEIRYENQPWYDTLANGVGKMLGTAGTTFISSLVGLPYGIGAAINQGRWSAIWDNSVTKGLADVDSWLEKNMTNYKSKEQKENPWYDPSNLFSMNFIADDVIKNAGFTVGAAASMAVGSGALGLLSRSLGFVNKVGGTTKMAANTLGALFSATGEGMIEARHGVDNRNKIEKQRLREALTPEYNALQAEEELITREFEANRGKSLVQTGDGRLSDPAYDTYKQKMEDLAQRKNELDQKMQAGIQQIEESGLQMGNTILLANQGLLTINNMLQFSKAMTKSFDRARHMAESTEKYVKPFGVRAARTAEGTYNISGKNFGRVVAAVKNPVTEGSEEMNQQWIQSSAEAAYNEKDANDYWKAKLDKDSYRETSKGLYTIGNILDKGFQDSWGDAAQWEQFVVGALTGFLGSYSPTKIFNQDKKYGVLDPRRYGSWEGGSVNAIRDFDKEYNTFEENIDDVNKILQQEDFPSRVKNLVAHTYLEGQKENAANSNDIKAWKDADDKQTIHDIQAFIRAGKLDDLKAIYEEMGADLSDEDIENIVKSTTREISAEEDKANFDQQIDEQIAAKQREVDALYDEQIALERSLNASTEDSREANQEYVDKQGAIIEEKIAKGEKEIADLNQQKEKYVGQKKFIGSFVDDKGNRTHTNDDIRQEIKHNTSELNRKLNSYLDSIAVVNAMTNGNLSKDQEDNLAYLHNLSKEKIVRFDKIMAKVRKQLPNNFLLKTSKTPEQLSKEFASSDLAFKQDETTPKGYVEVDTSLMNDKNFGVFFMDTIMRGNNIEAEPAEEDNKKEGEKDEKKKTVKQEKKEEQIKKDIAEQKDVNVTNYKRHFYDSMRQNTNMTLDEIRQAYEVLEKDIDDASVLKDESQEFFNTYIDYMTSPQKVDQDREKETQKVVDEQQKESVKDSSIRELAQRTDLKELLAKAKEDSDIPLINKIKKAMLLRQQQAKTQSAARDTSVLAGYNPADKEAAIKAQMRKLEKQLDVAEDSDRELTMQELADRLKGYDVQDVKDAIQEGLNPVDLATLKQLEQADPDAFDKRMEEMTNIVQQALDDLESNLLSNLPDIDDSRIGSPEEAVQALTDKLGKENPEGPAVPKKQDEVNPIISVPIFDTEAPTKQDNIETVSDATVLDEDKRQGVSGVELQRSGQHPWRAVTRRVGYKSNVPYSEYLENLINTVQDPEEAHRLQKQLRRVITLEKVLAEKGAFSKVEQGKVTNVIKFAVSKAVNEEAGDFVIFMTDEQGNILADLPSSDPEIEPNTNEIAGLADLYAEARKQWDALTEEEKDKTEFVPLKGLSTKVAHTYFGKVRYQDQRQSLNELFGDEKFTLAIKVANNESSNPVAFLDTGKKNLQGKTQRDKIREPLTGTKGQPYVLIPTSKANKENARGEGYLAVPILTPTFGELSNDSKFYQVVKDLLERIKSGKVQTKQAKELLSNLFGVSNVHVNFDGDITKKGSGITITTFARTNQSEKGNSHTVFKGSKEEMDIDAILEALGRFYINISNKKINTTEPFYTLSTGEKVYYNNMIGEIATTNAAMPHTVNDFFTVVPLEKKDGKFQQVAKKPARMKFPVGNMNSVFNVKVSYKDGTQKMWSIHPSEGFECRDEQGRPIYEEDKIHTASEKKLAAQYKAEAFGRFYMKDFSQPFVVMIDDKAYLYNPADRTFKSAKELESTYPRYNKNLSEYDALQDMLTSMEVARQEAEEAGVIAGNANKEKESLRKEGESILRKLGYKSKDRHSNGHVRGGQSGWKLRFIVKNPATGKAFTQEEVNADKDAYLNAALPLLNWLKEYFSNPDGSDTISTSKPQSNYGGYAAHYHFTDKDGHSREPFKFLTGGEVGESDFTIYIGSIEDVEKFMSDVKNSPINDALAIGNNNKSDVDFNGKIHGRIEGRSIGFSGYMLPEGLQKIVPNFSTVYEDDRVEISINDGEYLVKDKKTGKYHGVNFTAADKDSAIGYVANNILKIRNKIAENIYGEYIKGKTIEKTSEAKKQENVNRVNATISKLQTDGAKFTVCDVNGKEDPNGDFYKDENDLLHARVTSMAEGDPQVEPFKETLDNGEENPWIKPSTTIGNQVDEFIRVFFEGGDPMSINTPALSESSKNKLLEDLKQIQKSITKQGWKVASRNIVASGIIGVTDANGDQLIARVAGTLDLLLYNPEKDEYAIYDIKTHRGNIDFSNVGKDSHISKWSAQLSLYKELLEAKYPEMKGKIVGLKIIPIKVSQDSYDADVHTYTERDNHLYDENEKEVKAVFNYDGQTIPISERALKINMGKKGFKASYNSKEGRNQIIISKPRPLPGEAPKQKVKEGILKVINKVSDKRSISDYLKQSHKGLPEAVALCATIDEARKNGTLADLMLTEATMNMLSDMLNESLIDKHAALDKLNLSGLAIPGNVEEAGNPALPNAPKGVPIDDSSSPETFKEKATKRGIIDKTTEKAWERLSEENKQKVANTANHIQVKKALQDAQRNPRKDPNKLVGEYLHRKAVETSGYKKLNIQKELEWLNKVLPQLSRLNKVRIVEGLIRCSDGTWDYGQLRNGLLYIGTNGKEGTVYHEAFHAVTQWLLTDTELDALYEAARERYGNLDVVSLEERLADDFMAYTMGVKPSYKPRHRNIFQKLWDAIKKMLGHTSMIDKLYQNINDGVYAGAVLRFGDNEFADITSEDRDVSMCYNFLDKEQVARLNEGQVTKEQYEVLDSNEKRYLFHCVL